MEYSTHVAPHMIFLDINWLNISIDLLMFVFVIVCLLMILVILMQRPKQEGLGAAFGGGVTDQVFGARTTDVLQKATVYLGSAFFMISLTLTILVGQKNKTISVIKPTDTSAKVIQAPAVEMKAPTTPSETTTTSPAVEVVPAAPAATPTAEVPAPAAEIPATPPAEVPVAPVGQ